MEGDDQENSPSGLWRQLGKLVGCKPSGVRIPHSPLKEIDSIYRVILVALMLCSIYATNMSRNSEEPVFNQIEQVRTAQGLSRQELADLVGVHYQTIGYLERGEYSPSLVLALRIAKALNREVSELFSLTEPKKGKK